VASNGLSTISKPRVSSSDIARQWLVKFGEICQRDVTPSLAQIWVEQLRDIAPDLLERACDRVAKTWTSGFLPTPGNIRAAIDQANAIGLQFKSEKAWEHALKYATRFYHPDLGVSRDAPELPAAIEHAIRVSGGLRWIEGCPESELQWARKRFLEAYTKFHELGHAENLLSDSEAKKLLRDLNRRAKGPLALPAAGDSAGEKPERRPAALADHKS
jgi:hypothetical protein